MRLLISLILISLPVFAQTTDNNGTYSQKWWGRKAFHFSAGFSIAWGGAKLKQPKLGLALGWAAGIAKELSDDRYGETKMSQRRDIIITGLGATAGYLWATRKKDEPKPFDPVIALAVEGRSATTP